jgi:hypothetical protein
MPNASETRYISGYRCPNCGAMAIGIPHQTPPSKVPWAWSFRFPVGANSTVECFACDASVPREHWGFVDTVLLNVPQLNFAND